MHARLRLPTYFILDSCKIVFYSEAKIPRGAVKKALLTYLPELIENRWELESYLRDTYVFQTKLFQIATRFGVISRGVESRKAVSIRKLVERLLNTPIDEEAMKEVKEVYMDFEGAREVVKGLKEGKITIHEVFLNDPSPLSAGILTGRGVGRAVLKMSSADAVLKAVRERIHDTQIILVCTYCGWHSRVRVRRVPEKIRCPKCGSPMIGVAKHWDEEAVLVARRFGRKIIRGNKKFRELRLSAELVKNYGKTAVEVLAGRGIGPKTAAWILSRYYGDERRLYEAIIRAEINFEKSKRFWSGKN